MSNIFVPMKEYVKRQFNATNTPSEHVGIHCTELETIEKCKECNLRKNIPQQYQRVIFIGYSGQPIMLSQDDVFGTRRSRVWQTVAPHHGVWIIETNYCVSLAIGLTYMLFKMSQRHSSALLLSEMVSTVLCGYAAIIRKRPKYYYQVQVYTYHQIITIHKVIVARCRSFLRLEHYTLLRRLRGNFVMPLFPNFT